MAAFKRRIGDSAGGPTTFVSPATQLVGRLVGAGPYVFCGSMDGDCDIDGSVTLAAGSRWRGTIRAVDIVVAGDVEGDVVASGRVEVAGTGRVNGSLTGYSIAIAQGAVIEGEISVTSGLEPQLYEEKRRY
jgi:cytoskeletal protein CcmA (bactofilin family)